jgi:hypothetical protein
MEQWKSSGFEIKPGIQLTYYFKFKRVWFNYK